MALQPPPRLKGKPEEDIVALNEWVWGLFRSLEYEGEFALTTAVAALEADKIDPAQATAATAQETANTALTLAQGNDTELNAQEAGVASIAEVATTVVVTLLTAQTDTSYYVAMEVSAITGAPAADAYVVTGIAKTTTEFTVTVKAAPGAGTSIIRDWVLMR